MPTSNRFTVLPEWVVSTAGQISRISDLVVDETRETRTKDPIETTSEKFERSSEQQRRWGSEAFRFFHRKDAHWLEKERRIRTERTVHPTQVNRGRNISGGFVQPTTWVDPSMNYTVTMTPQAVYSWTGDPSTNTILQGRL